MRLQYRQFVRNLEDLLAMENSSEFSSMKLLQLMLETAGERYVDCESIMDILTRAAVTKSVESVVESWISVLEYHANKRRQLGDDRIHDEMHLAINGPEPAHSDPLVQKSMKAYWEEAKHDKNRSDWHFIRHSENIISYTVSKVIDQLRNAPENLPFMV